jgi:outer membrane protein assembly factor BamB
MIRTNSAVNWPVWSCAFAFCLVLSTVIARADDDTSDLIDAARQGDIERLQELIESGVDVNASDRFGITALWQGCSKGHVDVVSILLDAGAKTDVRDSVWQVSPLMMTEKPEIVRKLVAHGDISAPAKLRAAAMAGSSDMVRALLESREWSRQELAEAREMAKLGWKTHIVKMLHDAANKDLPDPPTIDEDKLKKLEGRYVDQRLNETAVELRSGKLVMIREQGRPQVLVPRDAVTFLHGAAVIEFQLSDQGVTGFRQVFPASPAFDAEVAARDTWPSFRGVQARGIAIGQHLPDAWDGEREVGVRWKTPIAGLSNSSPIVWKDRVFVTTAVSGAGKNDMRIGLYGAGDAVEDDSEHSWQVLCLDLHDGKVLWEREAERRKPPVKRHLKSTQANSTPVTDGQHVVALFNSGGLYCYDVEGTLLWKQDLGTLDSGAFNDPDYQWGFGSSPIIYRNLAIVQCDLQQGSFLAAFDLNSGAEVWREERDEVPSWGTPTVCETDGGPLLITNALDGQQRWSLEGNSAITVPTPFVAHDLVYVTSGYRPIQPIYAIKLAATGDISLKEKEDSNEAVAWSTLRGGPYLPTPIVYGDYLYICANSGILTCYDAKTGDHVYRKRVSQGDARSFTASLIAADGKIYITAESGTILVVKAGPVYELLGANEIGEYCLSTPAIAGGLMLVRTHKHLVAIGRPQ